MYVPTYFSTYTKYYAYNAVAMIIPFFGTFVQLLHNFLRYRKIHTKYIPKNVSLSGNLA